MSDSFTKKILQASLTLGGGRVFASGKNTKLIDGLRMSCEVEKGGEPTKNKCKLKIYGMLPGDMTELTALPGSTSAPLVVHKNKLQVLAGDASGLAIVFSGDITEAYASYQAPPNLYFHVEALEGFYPAIAKADPRSFKGATAVSALMKSLADLMGYGFEDNGVQVMLTNPYLGGSLLQQAKQLALAANIDFGIDNDVLFIAPLAKARKGTAPEVSAATGMKEYPIFDKKGLKLHTLYNKDIKYKGQIHVTSVVKQACGNWYVHGMAHSLECEAPSGQWFTKILASRLPGGSNE